MTKDRNIEECIQLATDMEAARDQVKDIQELQKQVYQAPVHSSEVHAVKIHPTSPTRKVRLASPDTQV